MGVVILAKAVEALADQLVVAAGAAARAAVWAAAAVTLDLAIRAYG